LSSLASFSGLSTVARNHTAFVLRQHPTIFEGCNLLWGKPQNPLHHLLSILAKQGGRAAHLTQRIGEHPWNSSMATDSNFRMWQLDKETAVMQMRVFG
jgi:hypothetical protein